MDNRRFFTNTAVNESCSGNKNKLLLENIFAELNMLYEDTKSTTIEENEDDKQVNNPDQKNADNNHDQGQDEQDNHKNPEPDRDARNKLEKDLMQLKKEVQQVDIPEIGIKLEGKADELYDQLISKLQDSKLSSAVEILQIVAADAKLSKLLKHGFSDTAGEEHQIQVSVTPDISLKTNSLIPTQNVVVVSNSLDNLVNGYFVTKDESGKDIQNSIDYTRYFTGDAPVPQTFVYQAGGKNYIIDGHHRWSQAYCMNPYGTLKCTVVTGPDIGADAALKNFQAAIAVDEATKKLPSSQGKGENLKNLFEINVQELGKTVAPMTEETAEKIVTAGNGSKAFNKIEQKVKQAFTKGSDALHTAKALLVTNALTLKTTVKPGTNNREIMPQADIKKVTSVISNGALPISK